MTSDRLLQCQGVLSWNTCGLKAGRHQCLSVVVPTIIIEWTTHLNEGYGVDKGQRNQQDTFLSGLVASLVRHYLPGASF